MSKEEYKEYTEFKAPVTGWEVLIKSRWFFAILVIAFVVLVFQSLIPRSIFYGVYAGLTAFVTAYLYLGLPEGWALNTLDMAKGYISLIPLNRFQLERMQTTNSEIMTFPSESGTVALVGHRLVSLHEETGKPEIHPFLELQTNSELANHCAKIQSMIITEYLAFKRGTYVEVNSELMREIEEWQKLKRGDIEN